MKNEITKTLLGSEFTKKLLKGVDLIGNAIGFTMGPYGRNLLIERRVHVVPIVTNDGKRGAKAIRPKDPIENMAVRVICEAAENTDLKVGDGTSATIVLAQAIIHEAFSRLDTSDYGVKITQKGAVSVVDLRKQINEAKEKVLKQLEKNRRKITNLAELTKSAITSVEDKDLGETIAKIINEVGANGYTFVEESFNSKTETEIIKGMRIDGAKLAHNFMVLNTSRMETTIMNCPILVTNHMVKDFEQFAQDNKGNWIGNDLMLKQKKAMIIFAWKFEKEFLKQVANLWNDREVMVGNQRKIVRGFKIICVKLPSILTEQLKDIAIYVNARLYNESENMPLSDVKVEDLGSAEKVTINMEEGIIVGGAGKKDQVEKRIEEVREQLKTEKLPEFKKRYDQRIADLASGIGIIKVGFNTQVEQLYIMDKIQDAVLSTKEAMKDGVVKGGGLALKEISEKLPKGNILKEPLLACYNKIQENAGEGFDISEDVVDPYNVVKASLENACSVAGTIIMASGAIFDEQDVTLDELKGEITKLASKVGGKRMPEDPAMDR